MNSSLIFDVGLHLGEDTAFYLAKGFNVVAFEADPDHAEFCRQRFSREIQQGALTIVEGAIVRDPSAQQVSFFKNKNNSAWGTVNSDWAERNEFLGTDNERVEVPSIDFRKCLEVYGIPYYMKIDVEGMDTFCLECLEPFLPNVPNYISIESEKKSFGKLKKEIELFDKLGYGRFKLVQQSGLHERQVPVLSSSNSNKTSDFKAFEAGGSGNFGDDLGYRGWRGYRLTVAYYALIFIGYRLFGDAGLLSRSILGKAVRRGLTLMVGHDFPGWYDTHASRKEERR